MRANSIQPNFFIVGAPKCGTTSLYHYLRQHPQVFMPEYKEPHFFSPDVVANAPVIKDIESYIEIFSEANDAIAIGEASVFYLFSDVAPREIRRFNPRSKIIILLRNPVDFVFSLHQQAVFGGMEPEPVFEKALELSQQRSDIRNMPKSTTYYPLMRYRHSAHFAPYVRNYIQVFGRHNVCILTLDDLKSQPDKLYKNVLDFLGVDSGFQADFSVAHNASSAKLYRNLQVRQILNRNIWIRNVLHRVPPRLRRLIGNIIQNSGGGKWNRPSDIDPVLERNLRQEFASTIDELESLLNWDLKSWKKSD